MKIFMQSIYNWYRNAIRHPKYRWWIILGTLVYLLSPFDFSPDIFPIVGEIDDIALLTLLITELSQVGFEYIKSRKFSAPSSTEVTNGETIDVEAVSTSQSKS